MLNSGEVADLFDSEEMDGIAMELKAAAAEASIPDTRQAVYVLFIEVMLGYYALCLVCTPYIRFMMDTGQHVN